MVKIAPGGEFQEGATVATAMGGMGRQFEGSYAEYTCVPAGQVQVSSRTSTGTCHDKVGHVGFSEGTVEELHVSLCAVA